MVWFNVDDTLAFHPKAIKAGNAALGLWVRAGSVASVQGGEIESAVLRTLGTARQIRQLEDLDLIADLGDGSWRFVDCPLWKITSLMTRAPIPNSVRALVYGRDGHRCRFCGTAEDLTLDHIYPWSLGGSDLPENLQTLCRSCNARKGARVEPVVT